MREKLTKTGLIALLFALGLTLVGCSTPTLDISMIESGIEDWAENNLGVTPGTTTANCPEDQPSEAGYSFICTLSDSSGTFSLRVDVLNENGDVQWEVLG